MEMINTMRMVPIMIETIPIVMVINIKENYINNDDDGMNQHQGDDF